MLFIGTLLHAQNCDLTFSGIIEDQHDDSVLSEAVISVVELGFYTYSDAQGAFTLTGLCPGNYSLEVSHEACKTRTFSIKVIDHTTKVLKLEHHYEKLNEILIKGNSGQLETAQSKNLDETLIAQKSDQSLGDLVSSVSGVSGVSSGRAIVKPAIHGLHSSRVTIINSGVRMEDQEWGSEHAPNVDINLAHSIEIIKNASALQYSGDGIGGFIVLKPQRIPVKDTLYGKTRITAQSNGRGGSVHAGLVKSSYLGWYGSVEGTFKKFGDYSAPDYVLSNTGMESHTLAGRLGVNKFKYGVELNYNRVLNNLGILRASHLGGAQDQFIALSSPRPLIINDFTYRLDRPKQEVTHQIASFKAFLKSSVLGRVDLRYDYQQNNRLEFDIRRGSDQDKASLDLELKTHALSLDLSPEINDLTQFKTGISARFINNTSNPNTGIKRLIPDYKRYDFGLYALASKTLFEGATMDFAARLDYMQIKAFKYYYSALWEERNYGVLFPEFAIENLGTQILTRPVFDYLNPSTSVGIDWRLNDQNELLLNFALGARNPNPSELFSEGLHHSASRIEIGDLRFKPEISKNFSLSYNYNASKFRVSINPFFRLIDRFILLEPTGIQQTIRGNFQVWSYRQADVMISGVDFDAQYELIPELTIDQQFSLVKGYELAQASNGRPLINLPPARINQGVTYKSTALGHLEMRLESNYTFRQNEFPNTNFEAFIPETQTLELIDVSTPPEAYHLINLELRYPVFMLKKSMSHLSFRIDNLFNTSYRNYLNSNRFYADELGRNLMLSFTTTF